MDEELDLAPEYQEESRTITDETRQAACATDTPDHGSILRIKQDRRNGHTGIYPGFERRGRLNPRGAHDAAAVGAKGARNR
jgi:hypothetical protein